MPDMHINVSGVWKRVVRPHVNVSSVWKGINNAYVNVGGVWKQFFSWVVLSGGDGGTVSQVDGVAPFDSTVGIRFNTDGTVEKGTSLNGAAISWVSAGTWIDPVSEITGTEDVRFTNFNGAGGGDWTTEASADDAWIAITTTRTYLMHSTSAEVISFTCDFEVRDTGIDTGSSAYTFSITNTV